MIRFLKKLFSPKPRSEELLILPPSEMGLDKHEDKIISEWYRRISRYWELGEVILERSSVSLERTMWFRIWETPQKKNGFRFYLTNYCQDRVKLSVINIVDGFTREEIEYEMMQDKMPELFESFTQLLSSMTNPNILPTHNAKIETALLDKLRSLEKVKGE